MNNKVFLLSLTNFDEACDRLGLDIVDVLDHFSKDLKSNLEATSFLFLKEGEILYKDGDKITGNEKVIRTEIVAGATCHFISDNCFKVSTEGLMLHQNNTEAINTFSKSGIREEKAVNEWPKALKLPEWIYFCKKTNHTSCNELEKHYAEVLPRVELNVLAAFNTKYSEFYKNFPNGIQRKDSKGKFCYAIFDQWDGKSDVNVVRSDDDWNDDWWFPCASN